MGDILTAGSLFTPELTNEMFDLVRGKSALARLSEQMPLSFRGGTVWTFSLDNEVALVAENGAKSNGGGTVGQVVIQPVKIEYGLRVSDEFRYASEEIRLDYLRTFMDGFAKKAARGLDIMAMHGVNPRTGSTASVLSTNNFDDVVTNDVTSTGDPNADVISAIALIEAAEHDVTGMAIAPAFRTALAAMTKATGSNESLFPELAWGASPSTINGLPVDVNSTVSFNSGDDLAIIGNFRDYFRWGYSRDVAVEVIEYGNPDNDGDLGDLKGHNQVYIRGEAYIGWGILVPAAFAKIGSFQ